MKAKLHLVLSITIFFSWFYGFSQDEYWKPILASNKAITSNVKDQDLVYEFESLIFKKALNNITIDASQIIYLPDYSGKLSAFAVEERSVFHPDLSKKYPQIKSFVGWNLERNKKARFSFSPNGIKVMLIDYASTETTFIEKISRDKNQYKVYKDSFNKTSFECKTKMMGITKIFRNNLLVDDQTLRRYRIAVSTTGEYTNYHGGTVSDALAAINATLTRINEVFESDLGVTLELVSNNEQVIFTNASTDPYTNNLNAQVQNTLTNIIGEDNYDVGHLFHMDNDNGNAGFIGSVCSDNRKGSAFSSAMEPEGDAFDLDYVAHELGHQFGANHTWSFESESTGVQAEPASGTTIMGYAGIVLGNDVAPNGDDYFHYNSILQIADFLQTTSCAVVSPLTNVPPVIVPLNDYLIPKGTAFVLTGNASDTDINDILTYTWEQIDDGVVTTATFGPDNVVGANFRSLRPSTNPKRYFPKLSRVINGQLEQVNPEENSAWETISNIERDLNFALTVRDNASGGGQTSSDEVKVSVVNSAGPFLVTSQSTNEVYNAGSVQEITWDVANTNGTEVNATEVDIYLSINGGASFPTLLADNVPNIGSALVQIPGEATTEARVMVMASSNIFFAINATDFTILESSVVLNFEELVYDVCKPDNLQVPFVLETYGGFNETVSFSANLPVGLSAVFSPETANSNGTSVAIDITNISSLETRDYPIDIIATAPGFSSSTTITLRVFDANLTPVALTSPSDGATATSVNPEFLWVNDVNAEQYDIQIATDDLFVNIVESATTSFSSFQSSNLQAETNYFWRVRPKNDCGEGIFGLPFSFTTSVIDCKTFDTDQQPIEIIAQDPSVITSKISFVEDLRVADINVNLEISHTFLEDLIISLTSPSGNTVILTSKSCGNLNNINAVFDDDGIPIVCGDNPALQGVISPLGSLSSFNGESILGDWILTIEDTAASDGGSLDAFSMEVCVEGIFRPDDDEDGVFDDGDDLCLGTPKGLKVDTSGCPLNEFPQNNFNIAIESETCRSNNDGVVIITTADTSINYIATLTGNGQNSVIDFMDEHSFQALSSGTYNLCLTGSNDSVTFREQCFEIVIDEPEILSVSTSLITEKQQVLLEFSGADFYTIELNGIATQTKESSLLLDLENGNNTLKVSTDLPCQGIYEEQIVIFQKPILFPNPVNEFATIQISGNEQNLFFELFALNGQLISSKAYEGINRELNIDLSSLPDGLYFAVLTSNAIRYTYKVIKQ
ncbi:reprolysin-like metallopeptidase [Croceitalea rosinachiae]|uniref:M12 family metallo-peptidase n=1 Tax=Croceitalea rosinachiae TaxID=3075596 RepID=A0ABU3AA80_9FLAO|nr:zinc-dependent metalloprotease family protein [Croceitalea sp. F388]MDT0605851.1 M12 family metallo-peptidase [Croceitalea sp. F388]